MIFSTFYSPAFLEIIKRVYKLKELDPFLEKGFTRRFPVLASRLPFKSRIGFSLPLGFYQTADYIKQLASEDDWAEICEYSKRMRVNISLASIGELPFGNGIHIANNPILELREGREPFERYSKNHQQNIRKERNKADGYGVAVSFTVSNDDLFQFYNVMSNQYVKDHMMVFQPFNLFSGLMSSGMGRLLVVKHGDEVLGGMFCIIDGDVFHYNWGVRKRFRNLNIGTLLIDYAVTHAYQGGYRYFDFGSTPLSDNHLYQFKMKWGGDNHRVYKHFTKAELPQTDLNTSFMSARNVYSKIPPKIAQRMMPFVVPWLVS
jgi:GNAT superfamily N-acetyltransferase